MAGLSSHSFQFFEKWGEEELVRSVAYADDKDNSYILFQFQIWMTQIAQWNITLFFEVSNDSTPSTRNIREIWTIMSNQIS